MGNLDNEKAAFASCYMATVTFPCVGGPALFTTLLGSFITMGMGVMGAQGRWPPGGLLPAINARPAKKAPGDKYSNHQLVRSRGEEDSPTTSSALLSCIACCRFAGFNCSQSYFMR